MANRYKVEYHPKKKQIVKDLINQVPYYTIAKNYGITLASIRRYARGILYPYAAKAVLEDEHNGQNLLERIEDTIVNVQKMYDACDEWLQDPENPEKYTLGPRAEEMKVIYTVQVTDCEGNTHTVRKSRNLQEMIDYLAKRTKGEFKMVETKRADPRNLILQTAQTLTKQIEMLGKVAGVLKEAGNVTVNIDNSTKIVSRMVQIIDRETEACPDVRKRIVEGLTDAIKVD